MKTIYECLGITEERNSELIVSVLKAVKKEDTMSDVIKSFGPSIKGEELTAKEIELMYCSFHAGAMHIISLNASINESNEE